MHNFPRFGVSSAAAAAIGTGLLKDLIVAGHLPQDKAFLALDPNKIARARKAVMQESKVKDNEKYKLTRLLALVTTAGETGTQGLWWRTAQGK